MVWCALVHNVSTWTWVVVCQDVRNGGVRWMRDVALTGLNPGLLGPGVGEGQYALPALIHEDRVIVCFNQGHIVALDRVLGCPRWAVAYPRRGEEDRGPWAGDDFWADNPPFVAGGRLHVTPQDSDVALVLDPATGALLDLWPRRTRGAVYSVCMAGPDETVYLAGSDVWVYGGPKSKGTPPGAGPSKEAELPRGGRTCPLPEPVSGRGWADADGFYCPTPKALYRLAPGTRDFTLEPVGQWAETVSGPVDVRRCPEGVVMAARDGLWLWTPAAPSAGAPPDSGKH